MLPICFIDEEGYVFKSIITSEFYEYYDAKNERDLLKHRQTMKSNEVNFDLKILKIIMCA